MDYSQLSDFEINRMVGDIIFKGLWASKPETSGNNTNKWMTEMLIQLLSH